MSDIPDLSRVIANGQAATQAINNLNQTVSTLLTEAIKLVTGVPFGATIISGSSGNQANANAAATLPGVSGKTTYITGFVIQSSGASGASVVNPTVTGTIGGTMTFTYTCLAGVTVPNEDFVLKFPHAIPASAQNAAIVVTLPALGSGATNATVVAFGYQL